MDCLGVRPLDLKVLVLNSTSFPYSESNKYALYSNLGIGNAGLSAFGPDGHCGQNHQDIVFTRVAGRINDLHVRDVVYVYR